MKIIANYTASASTRFQLQDTPIRGKDIRRKSDCRATRGVRRCARAAAVLLERKSMQAEDIVKVQKRVAYAGREAETVPRQDSGQAHQLHLRKFIDRLAAPQRVEATCELDISVGVVDKLVLTMSISSEA
uniref:Uncharacterized protein n=1 Tax=Trichogramma kaykai TaxID=54128 RepID=A0ABD2W4T3_9HYME